jgi:hypothetical protein
VVLVREDEELRRDAPALERRWITSIGVFHLPTWSIGLQRE